MNTDIKNRRLASVEDYKKAIQLLGLRSNSLSFYRSKKSFFCPFHNETVPSFHVDFEKGVYHCFSCKASGTIEHLVYQLTGKGLKTLLGRPIQYVISYDFMNKKEEIDEDSIPMVKISGEIVPFYKERRCVEYIEKRGIDISIAKKFFFMYGKDVLINETKFVDRLIIPVFNSKRVFIAAEGRALNPNDQPKSKSTYGFHRTIFNHSLLDKQSPLFIVEGIIDLSLLQSDPFFQNSSHTFGSNISRHQLSILNTFSHVIIIPDNDEAGKKEVDFLYKNLTTKFSVLKIKDNAIKDIGEIPEKLHMSVKQFRENNGFEYYNLK